MSSVLPAPLKVRLRRLLRMGPPGYPLPRASAALRDQLRLSYNVAGCELHALTCLRSVRRAATLVGRPIQGEVLEVGSYGHPGLALALLYSGAGRVHLNNVTPITNRLPRSYAETIAALMGTFDAPPNTLADFVRPAADGNEGFVELLPDRLNVLPPGGAEHLDLPAASLDMLFSITVFEHVPRPRPLLDNMFRMLKPGGWSCHDIDLRDHVHLEDAPLDLLRLSAEEFAALPATHPNRGGNRGRASDYAREFRAAGFELPYVGLCLPHGLAGGLTDNYGMAQEPLARTFADDLAQVSPWVTRELRAALHPDFQRYSLEELSVTGLQIVAVKPAGNDA